MNTNPHAKPADGVSQSVIETIGSTPLVALNRLCADLPGNVLLKLEYLNPGHSIKDRIARQIIADAETSGLLKAGGTIIEVTSGNTGTGLAIVCGLKGYRLICVMSEGNSPERARMMRALGAEVVLVPQVAGSLSGQVSGADFEEVERVADELALQHSAFRADQFDNESNHRAHEMTTGLEIWEQTGGEINTFISIAGTGGSFAGVARALKNRNPAITCFVIEPEGAPFLARGMVTNPKHKIQGAGYARALPQIAPELTDGFLTVSDAEAIAAARELAKREGIFGGFSTGANVAVALRLAREAKPGETIVTFACDSGLKYLSTDLYAGTIEA
jgi:cysteine synthase A